LALEDTELLAEEQDLDVFVTVGTTTAPDEVDEQ
jgi:hypothetical protein